MFDPNEPTGNLNSAQREEIMKMFKQLNDEETTLVQVTHSFRSPTPKRMLRMAGAQFIF